MTNPTSYDFPPLNVRAQCIQIVDAFTLQLLLDCGFANFHIETLHLRDIEPPDADELWESVEERGRQREIQQWLRDLFKPIMVMDAALLNDWPLRVVVHKTKPRVSVFPRKPALYVADVYVLDPVVRSHMLQQEIHVNAQLKELGLGRPLHQR